MFRAAIGMSGTYDLRRFFDGPVGADFTLTRAAATSCPRLDRAPPGPAPRRFVVLASGEGANEDIGESWRMAAVLGGKGVPNRVDPWGPEWPHDWPLWRAMLPRYLDELVEG